MNLFKSVNSSVPLFCKHRSITCTDWCRMCFQDVSEPMITSIKPYRLWWLLCVLPSSFAIDCRERDVFYKSWKKTFISDSKNFMLPHFDPNITQMQSFWRQLRNIVSPNSTALERAVENEAFLKTPHCVSWLKNQPWKIWDTWKYRCDHLSAFFVFALTCNGVSEFHDEPMRGRALTARSYDCNSWGCCADETSDQNSVQCFALFPFKSGLWPQPPWDSSQWRKEKSFKLH